MNTRSNKDWIWNWIALSALAWISFSFVSTAMQAHAIADQSRQFQNTFSPRPTLQLVNAGHIP